ncbi:hypothetical protein P8C59_000008 [Phyllachora maydis]|uniref:Uncharacterized protein n=1 Tax=Phyllachora maydis TaxID=1825666 RepID=A0AAD9HUU7_9PEZI|nr:hypothetical protein P8C59_000008 [Phyllachora maydis]
MLRHKEEAEEEAAYKAEIATYKARKYALPILPAIKKAALAAIYAGRKALHAAANCFLELRSNLATKAKHNSAKYILVLVDKMRALVEHRAPIAGITPI